MYIVVRIDDNVELAHADSMKKVNDYFKLRRGKAIPLEDLVNKKLYSKKYDINIKIIKNEEKWQKLAKIIFLVKLENKL